MQIPKETNFTVEVMSFRDLWTLKIGFYELRYGHEPQDIILLSCFAYHNFHWSCLLVPMAWTFESDYRGKHFGIIILYELIWTLLLQKDSIAIGFLSVIKLVCSQNCIYDTRIDKHHRELNLLHCCNAVMNLIINRNSVITI